MRRRILCMVISAPAAASHGTPWWLRDWAQTVCAAASVAGFSSFAPTMAPHAKSPYGLAQMETSSSICLASGRAAAAAACKQFRRR